MDYSFWSEVTSSWNNTCIQDSDPNYHLYPIVRKCIAHQNEKIQDITAEHCNTRHSYICPNSLTSKTDCKKIDKFFCDQSKSCIDHDKTCDGIVHCVHAEDEDWDLCKTKFDETATFKCIEKNRGSYNIFITATPCSGQCRDENCDQDRRVVGASIGLTFAAIVGICSYIHFKTTKKYPAKNSDIIKKIDLNTANARNALKGDDLAKIKVIINSINKVQKYEVLNNFAYLFTYVCTYVLSIHRMIMT